MSAMISAKKILQSDFTDSRTLIWTLSVPVLVHTFPDHQLIKTKQAIEVERATYGSSIGTEWESIKNNFEPLLLFILNLP